MVLDEEALLEALTDPVEVILPLPLAEPLADCDAEPDADGEAVAA